MKQNHEIRYGNINYRSDDEQNVKYLEGKAISFETWSNDLGFREILHKGCITDEVIKHSDIVFKFNHLNDSIIARSKYGEGTLSIEVKDDGVYFSFPVPDTTEGHDLYESVKRGDLTQNSFAFTIDPDDEGAENWYYDENNELKREIFRINELFDLSCVINPAYNDTEIHCRSLEIKQINEEKLKQINNTMKENEIRSQEEEVLDEERQDIENQEVEEKEDSQDEKEENRSDETETEKEAPEEKEDEAEEEVEEKEDDEEEKEEKSKRNHKINKKTNTRNIMKFNLVKTINDIKNHRGLDEATMFLNDEAIKESRNAGVKADGDFCLPVDYRATIKNGMNAEGNTEAGSKLIETEIKPLLEVLRDKNVLVQAGCNFLTGLTGNISIPSYSGTVVAWKGESVSADDGAGTFDSVELSPKRLTAYVTISNSLLMQANQDVEAYIYNDIVNAINEKLQQTILGGTQTANAPEGILYPYKKAESPKAIKAISEYADILDMEADVEDANINGNCAYVLSNKAKAALKGMIKGTNATGMVMEGAAVDGTPAYNTKSVAGTGVIYGDFSKLFIGQWGSVNIKVDDLTRAKYDETVLVVNAYFDAALVRPEAIVYGEI